MDTPRCDKDNIDKLIIDLGGCGRYQIALIFFVSWVKVVSAFSMMVMAFGNYNPGWTCISNNFTSFSEFSGFVNSTSKSFQSAYSTLSPRGVESNTVNSMPTILSDANVDIIDDNTNNDEDKCVAYSACPRVQFLPGVSTIVTEWGLICDLSWIPSLILSIQMFGVLVGSYLFGYLGDRIGRKSTMYASTFFHGVINIVAIFSNSWQMFAVVRFLIGVAIPMLMCLPIILALEYVPFKWRNVLICFPLWTFGCLFFALFAWITEDWRYLHGIIAAASFVSMFPCYWIPESLRWMMVKGRMKGAIAVASILSSFNKKEGEDVNRRLRIIAKNIHSEKKPNNKTTWAKDCLACLQLLKKSTRLPTIVVGFTVVTQNIIYYAISFGVKSLPGSLYLNFAILYSSELPMTLISCILPNYIGRKLSIIIFLGICDVCLFSVVGFEFGLVEGSLKHALILISMIIIRNLVDAGWDVCLTYLSELYPTVIRSTALAYSSWVSRIGGILAPYLIPNDPKSHVISYLIMAILELICCCLLVLLPNNKGKEMKEIWDDEKVVTRSLSDSNDDNLISRDKKINGNLENGDKVLLENRHTVL